MAKLFRVMGPSFSAAIVVGAGCNLQEPPPFDPRAMSANERSAARSVPVTDMPPLPTTLQNEFLPASQGRASTQTIQPPTTGPALETDPIVRIPLQEIMQRAVANNLDVKVAGFGPSIESTRTVEAEARFDPIFFTNAQYEDRDEEVISVFFSQQNGEIFTAQTGVRQNLQSGGQAEFRYEASRTKLSGSSITPNPFYESDLVLQVTQPLLRDFGINVNRARIVISRNNQRISLLDFRQQLEETATEIEQTYWQLVQSEQDVRIAEDLLRQTIRTAEILAKRMGQDVTRVQLSQANASVESRRAILVRARSRVRDLSDQLKGLMNDPSMPITSNVLILPATPPVEEPVRFDLEDQIDTAMEFRLELGQQQFRIDNAQTASEVAKNNLLPQLNLVGQVGAQGADGSYNDAVSNQFDFDHISYSAGIQFEIPIGNRAARATYQRSLLQRQQAVVQYQNLIEQVSLEVKTSLRQVDTTWDEMVARRTARFAEEDSLRAIEQRETAGEPLTPTFVQLKLDTQGRVADARSNEVEAVSNYNIAMARLEQSKGTLLRYNNIIMEENPQQLVKVWR
jgi:outer membrane protein TolC